MTIVFRMEYYLIEQTKRVLYELNFFTQKLATTETFPLYVYKLFLKKKSKHHFTIK